LCSGVEKMDNETLAVRCEGVEKTFGEGESQVFALRGVDLTVGFGEMTMLVGPSGCGKTTLLSVLTGLLNSSAGYVEVLGESLHSLSKEKRIAFRRKNLGFVFQQYNLLPALTAAENAAVPLLAAGIDRHCHRREQRGIDQTGNRRARERAALGALGWPAAAGGAGARGRA